MRGWIALGFIVMGAAACSHRVESAPPLPPPPAPLPPAPEDVPDAPPPGADGAASTPIGPGAAPTSAPQSTAGAQVASKDGPLPPLPSQAPLYTQTPDGPVLTADQTPPPATQWVHSYPEGQWVYTADYGWIWVPSNVSTSEVEGVPYVYLWTRSYGWTWYVSPWGPGPYRYGVWVRHPWHPVGWHGGWVAHPRVVVRIGGHPHPVGHAHRR